MSSFYAELTVAGHTYPVRLCTYEFNQATNERGRPAEKVRHDLVRLTLDVPEDDFLHHWGNEAYKPLAGQITFFETDQRTARESVSWTEGHCVGYHEVFESSNVGAGSYVCHVRIAAPKLTLSPGRSGPYTPPAPRSYAAPAPLIVPPRPAEAVLTKQQRYDKRMRLLSEARAKLAQDALPAAGPLTARADATRVAPGALAARLSQDQQHLQLQQAVDQLSLDNVAVERAKLSEHVYHILEKPPVAEPEGWHMLTAKELAAKGITPDMLLDPESGFKAALYQSTFERPPKLVISYAGTEDLADWKANMTQGIGLETDQYTSAMNLAKAVVLNSPKGTVDVTGHSLGGGLASAATAVTGAKGYTFNSAGLHPNTAARDPFHVAPEQVLALGQRIDAYHSTADPLTNFQGIMQGSLGGLVGADAGWPLAPEALGIPHALPPAPTWQHEWGEFAHNNPLGVAKNMGLHGHGVDPQMVDNIEARKDQDTATLTRFVHPEQLPPPSPPWQGKPTPPDTFINPGR